MNEQQAENICLFDMDGTLADYDTAIRESWEAIRSPMEADIPVPQHSDERWPSWMENRMNMIRRIPGWWLNLKPLDVGLRILGIALNLQYQVMILTKGNPKNPLAWKEKVEWCQEYLDPSIKITVTEDKGLVYGRVLVDDYPPYIGRWLEWRPRGLVIMPDAPWNKSFANPNVLRCNGKNYNEVQMAMQAVLKRKPGQPLVFERDYRC